MSLRFPEKIIQFSRKLNRKHKQKQRLGAHTCTHTHTYMPYATRNSNISVIHMNNARLTLSYANIIKFKLSNFACAENLLFSFGNQAYAADFLARSGFSYIIGKVYKVTLYKFILSNYSSESKQVSRRWKTLINAFVYVSSSMLTAIKVIFDSDNNSNNKILHK